jgi:hypothetical protein
MLITFHLSKYDYQAKEHDTEADRNFLRQVFWAACEPLCKVLRLNRRGRIWTDPGSSRISPKNSLVFLVELGFLSLPWIRKFHGHGSHGFCPVALGSHHGFPGGTWKITRALQIWASRISKNGGNSTSRPTSTGTSSARRHRGMATDGHGPWAMGGNGG